MNNVLVVAPHPDDELLGCGGTILKHISNGDSVYVCIVTKGVPPLFPDEDETVLQPVVAKCHAEMGVKKTFFLNFPASMIENIDRYKLNSELRNVIESTSANILYIPHYGDMQKDHQLIAEACMVAARPKYRPVISYVFGYETMSETAWNTPNIQNEFIPNWFEDITPYIKDKIKYLSYYEAEIKPFPDARSLGAIDALAKYRGSLIHVGAAESFMLLRCVNL